MYKLICCLCLISSLNVTVSAQGKPYDFSPLSAKIQDWVDKGFYSGASVMIVQNDEVIYKHHFGNYGEESVAYIASAGKWLAAATIAVLVDEGKLSWDDKVAKWLPEFSDQKGQATLRQLLSHTSGFPEYQPAGVHRDDYQTLRESVFHIVNLPSVSKPGTHFSYGGLAMQVAGRMAELSTGKSWETIFQEKMAKPLGMTHTHFSPVDSTAGHNPMLGGGARASLKDYVNFLSMIYHKGVFKGKRILSEKAIAELQADQVRKAEVKSGEYVEKSRKTQRKDIYGLGEWREETDAGGNAILISSPGWAGAYPWIDKKANVFGFFMARVNVEKANKARFSSFYASPVLPVMLREIVRKSEK